jgi:hypothetical protein
MGKEHTMTDTDTMTEDDLTAAMIAEGLRVRRMLAAEKVSAFDAYWAGSISASVKADYDAGNVVKVYAK